MDKFCGRKISPVGRLFPQTASSPELMENDVRRARERSPMQRWQRIAFVVAGIIAFVGAFPAQIWLHASPSLCMLSSAGGIAMFMIGVGFERQLTSVSAGKDGVKADAAEAIVADAQQVNREAVETVASWTQATFALVRMISSDSTSPQALEAVTKFLRSRLEDICQAAADADEELRAGVWLADESETLRLLVGTSDAGRDRTFNSGEGVIGGFYRARSSPLNVPSAADRGDFVDRSGDELFHGMLLASLDEHGAHGAPGGVLCLERTSTKKFEPATVALAQVLCSLVCMALDHAHLLKDGEQPTFEP